MTLEELQRELDGGSIRPAYLLAGAEPLLRDDALAALLRRVLGEGTRTFDLDRLDGESASAGQLLDAARTLPVTAERRLVVLREPEARRGTAAGLTAAIVELLGELAEDATTVLAVCATRIDRRSAWVRAFRPPAVIVACDAPQHTREVVAFVRAEARRQRLELAAGAAELLAERIGPHLLLLRQELAKASLMAGEGGRITRTHVGELSSDLAEEPIWELTDAIGEGRSGDALRLLGRVVSAGAPPPVVLASLASHFRRLVRLRAGAPVSVPPFVRKKLEGQARRYGPERIRACLHAIHETDEALKGQGALGPQLALERLVLGLSR